ncbi:MAG TPA: hypothetical protein PKI41_07095 [Candidatus Competibacteraceae bacterium]|nr:MAG: hypothetical protein EKK71_12535 [Candidatus Competibacteraceae bacterium]HOB61875.1 hypothetical protein [Candidatus Competibacteraceae bacterium]HQA25439.1 hypothetical protein [Candidatus Competibacteraceae bacterium]HQD56109.1 hypothetical protein [Candidatus Competibacteraceae bacterium]
MPTAETDDGAPVGLSYAHKEEALLEQAWQAQDRAEYEQDVRGIVGQTAELRQALDRVRAQIDPIWEQFATLALERILSDQLRDFLDEGESELRCVNLLLVETGCGIDRVRAQVQERRRWLEEKLAALETLAHRTSTQNHLNMMLARVEGLETYLLGKPEAHQLASEPHHRHHNTLPSDLTYLRIRLLTTRSAMMASNCAKLLHGLEGGLTALLPDIERLKADLAAQTARVECMTELSHFWLAYLDLMRGNGEP